MSDAWVRDAEASFRRHRRPRRKGPATRANTFLLWGPYGAIPCEVMKEFQATPIIKAVTVRITSSQGPCLAGDIHTVNSYAVVKEDRANV